MHDLDREIGERRVHCLGLMPDDDEHAVTLGCERPRRNVPDEGFADEVEQLLRPAEAMRCARREDDGRDRMIGAQRVQSAVAATWPRIDPWAVVSGPPGRLWRTATISARMLSAISSGVSPPMLRPIGAWSRARCSSSTPAARSRSL